MNASKYYVKSDEIARRLQHLQNKKAAIDKMIDEMISEVNAISTEQSMQTFLAEVTDAATANRGSDFWKVAKETKDAFIQEFQAIKAEAQSLRSAVDATGVY